MKIRRVKRFGLRARLALVAVAALGCAGCEFDAEEFRSATSAPLQSGLTTITTGLLDGAFALYEPDPDSGDDASNATASE